LLKIRFCFGKILAESPKITTEWNPDAGSDAKVIDT